MNFSKTGKNHYSSPLKEWKFRLPYEIQNCRGGQIRALYRSWNFWLVHTFREGGINIACHVLSKIMFCTIFKVKDKVEVTSTTSIVIMFRPDMAGLKALRRPKFHFKNVIFDQIHNFWPHFPKFATGNWCLSLASHT